MFRYSVFYFIVGLNSYKPRATTVKGLLGSTGLRHRLVRLQ